MVFFSMARIQVLLLIVILTYCSICSARPYGIYEDYDNWSSESGSDPRQVFYKSIYNEGHLLEIRSILVKIKYRM